MKRREVKSKGEKERYTHLNAEFQRITRRDKKALPSDQCKETEEDNKMGKTSCEKKRSQKQRRKGKIYPFECRVPKNSKER